MRTSSACLLHLFPLPDASTSVLRTLNLVENPHVAEHKDQLSQEPHLQSCLKSKNDLDCYCIKEPKNVDT